MPTFANNGSIRYMWIVQSLIALILVGTVAYCTVMQIPIADTLDKLILLVLGAFFGFSAKVYHEDHANRSKRLKGK